MFCRSMLLAVLGVSLSGCAAYAYDLERAYPRYHGAGGYSVQRYDVYPNYADSRYYRYDQRRYNNYRYERRYYAPPPQHSFRYERRYDRSHKYRYDQHGGDGYRGGYHYRIQPRYQGRPYDWRQDMRRGWDRD